MVMIAQGLERVILVEEQDLHILDQSGITD